MGDYDVSIKNIFFRSAYDIVWALFEEDIARHISSDLFLGTPRYADAIYKTASGGFLHLEFQSSNDPTMGWRMVNYRTAIDFQQYSWQPSVPIRQIMLYFGDKPCTMLEIFEADRIRFKYEVHDIRDLVARRREELARLSDPYACIIVLLGQEVQDEDAWGELIHRVGSMQDETERSILLTRIEILARLRGTSFGHEIARRIREMAIDINIDHTEIPRNLVEEGIRNEILRNLLPEITVSDEAQLTGVTKDLKALEIVDLRHIADEVRAGAEFWTVYRGLTKSRVPGR
jgi:hypothetical protein